MNDLAPIRGSGFGGNGGGGGSAPHTPVEAPNTLRSRAYGVIMDIISAGPIRGLVDGGKSVFLQGVPLVDSDDNNSFGGVSYAFMDGQPTQSPVLGFNSNDAADPGYTVSVNTEVRAGSPGPVTRTVGDANATSALVVISVPQLVQTNTTNGDLNPTSVRIQIKTRANSAASYVTVVDDTISGKTTATYQRQYRITRPDGEDSWQIRVVRITDDSESVSLVNATFWASYTVLYDNLMQYPHTAYCMIQFDAALFGSQIPTRQYEVYGREIRIPSNYDPDTRVYTGVWDGTFVTNWTDNPAWVWYDLVTDEWSGAGEVIDPSTVDKWALYAIAQYCDELVPDGADGFEPRFTFNGVLDRPEDALRAMQHIASMFDSVVYANGSEITLVQDSPSSPVKNVTQANVENGDFSYQGTALSTRPTVVRALFIDPNDEWLPAVEVVDEGHLVAKYGYQVQDIQLLGVTSRGQAGRKALNTITLSWTSSEVVTFTAGLDMIDLKPGDLVLISDPLYAGIRLAGRCAINCTTTDVNLDSPVTLYSGQTYALYVTLADGTIESKTVSSASNGTDYTTIEVASPFSAAPASESVWLLAASNAEPRPFKVLTIAEKTHASVEVTALFYDTTRRDYVELGIRRAPDVFSILPATTGLVPLEVPSGMGILENLTGVGETTIVRVSVYWVPVTDPRVGSFQIEAINADGASTNALSKTNYVEFEGLPAGTYTIRVRSVSQTGTQVSAWLEETDVEIDGVSPVPEAPTGLIAEGGIQTVQLAWDQNAERDIAHYEVFRSPGVGEDFVHLGNTKATRYVDAETETLQPDTDWYYVVAARTTTGIVSATSDPAYALTLRIRANQVNARAIGTDQIQTQTVTQTSSDFMGLPTTPTTDWEVYASVTVEVPENGKVRIDVRTVTSGAYDVYGASDVDFGGSNDGGGGGEGDGGGSGEG